MKTPVPYVGGKQSIADQIISLMAPHDHYVEPYFGSGSVLFAKPRSAMETVNDVDQDLVTFWRVLRESPDELAWACATTPHSRTEMKTARAIADGDPSDMERARRVWVQLTQGRAARLTSTGWRYHITAAATRSLPSYLDGYLGRLIDAATRLRPVSLECRDGVDVILSYDAPGTCFYVDPPYLASTRGRTNLYAHEMPDMVDHQRLLDVLLQCKGQVILSGYPSTLYDDALAGWERLTVQARDQASRERLEVLWANRLPQPTLLEVTA